MINNFNWGSYEDKMSINSVREEVAKNLSLIDLDWKQVDNGTYANLVTDCYGNQRLVEISIKTRRIEPICFFEETDEESLKQKVYNYEMRKSKKALDSFQKKLLRENEEKIQEFLDNYEKQAYEKAYGKEE